MNIIEFLGLTRVESLAGVIVFFGLLFGISRLPKKKFTFAARVLIGTGIGTVYGLIVWDCPAVQEHMPQIWDAGSPWWGTDTSPCFSF